MVAFKPNEIEIAALWDIVEAEPADIGNISVGDFLTMILDTSTIAKFVARDNVDIRTIVARSRGLTASIEGLLKMVKAWDADSSDDERRAAKGVDFPCFAESVLIECVQFYHLHSTKEAESLPVSDWVLARKSMASENKYRRNYDLLQQKKLRRKDRRP